MHIIRLLKLFFKMILTAHIIACVWGFVGNVEVKLGYNDTWFDNIGITDAQWYTKYLKAFYFSCVTMITIGIIIK